MVGSTAQGVLIARSCAMPYCEPCQSLTAAALNRRWRVPRGSFEGATYAVTASVSSIEAGAQQTKRQRNRCLFVYTMHSASYILFSLPCYIDCANRTNICICLISSKRFVPTQHSIYMNFSVSLVCASKCAIAILRRAFRMINSRLWLKLRCRLPALP